MRPECDDQRDQRAQAALEATRRADAEERAHQEPEIEAPDVDEEAFQDVRVAPQVYGRSIMSIPFPITGC
jgi:hypothetical protein